MASLPSTTLNTTLGLPLADRANPALLGASPPGSAPAISETSSSEKIRSASSAIRSSRDSTDSPPSEKPMYSGYDARSASASRSFSATAAWICSANAVTASVSMEKLSVYWGASVSAPSSSGVRPPSSPAVSSAGCSACGELPPSGEVLPLWPQPARDRHRSPVNAKKMSFFCIVYDPFLKMFAGVILCGTPAVL